KSGRLRSLPGLPPSGLSLTEERSGHHSSGRREAAGVQVGGVTRPLEDSLAQIGRGLNRCPPWAHAPEQTSRRSPPLTSVDAIFYTLRHLHFPGRSPPRREEPMPATLTITPWPDPLLDTLGHDPRSLYVETFWLPTLGPTAVLLLRHLATRFDESPTGVELPVADTSQALG